MCEHVGLECPLAGCWCGCGRCEAIRQDYAQVCEACGGRGGFAVSGEVCSDCLGTGSIPSRCACGPDETGEAPDYRTDCPVHGADAPYDPAMSDIGEEPF